MYNTIKNLIKINFDELNQEEKKIIIKNLVDTVIREFNSHGCNIPLD